MDEFADLEEFSYIRLPTVPVPPTYNAAPQSIQPIIRPSRTGQLEVVFARWGLIPYWSKTAKIGYSTFNARAEELLNKPAFRESLKSRRCLVPASCFYEWQKLGPKEKQPFAIGMKRDEPFAFAGLWDRWRSPEGVVIESFTINTVASNEFMKPIHDRMPAVLQRRDYARWLNIEIAADAPLDLLRPFPAESMRCWTIDKAIGNVRNDSPELIKQAAGASDD
jgi:putative SOS response-associated peptidase YedK